MNFARWYADYARRNRRILVVPVSRGGTPFRGALPFGMTWKVGRSDGVNLTTRTIEQATKSLAAAGPGSRIVGALWLQGESDGDNTTTGADYAADLDELKSTIRTALALPDLPFVVGQMAPEYLKTGTRAAINTVQIATSSRVAHTAFAPGPLGMNINDGNHYNGIGERANGRSMFDALLRIVNGTPDTALPAVPTAPAGLVVTGVAEGVTATWTPVAKTVYYVQSRPTAGGAWARVGTTTTGTMTATGLAPRAAYTLDVTAINNTGPGASSSGSATATATPVNPVADDFARADSITSLGNATSGQPWTPGKGTWGIRNGRGYAVTAVDDDRALVGNLPANCLAQVTALSESGATDLNAGVILRAADSNNYYLASMGLVGGKGASIFKKVAGAYTRIAYDANLTPVAGDVIRLESLGNNPHDEAERDNAAHCRGRVTRCRGRGRSPRRGSRQYEFRQLRRRRPVGTRSRGRRSRKGTLRGSRHPTRRRSAGTRNGHGVGADRLAARATQRGSRAAHPLRVRTLGTIAVRHRSAGQAAVARCGGGGDDYLALRPRRHAASRASRGDARAVSVLATYLACADSGDELVGYLLVTGLVRVVSVCEVRRLVEPSVAVDEGRTVCGCGLLDGGT